MPTPPSSREGAPAPGAQRLEELVFEALERHAAGGTPAVEEFLGGHAAEAPALRAELGRLARVGLLPAPAGEPAATAFPERLGDFRLIEKLGEGGMGVVYAAEQVSLGRPVALKLVRPEQLYFAGARERFRREVEAVARLQHPGIVPVYAVGEEQGVPFFAMERLDGCTLADVLRALKGRDPGELSGADLAHALAQGAPPREDTQAAAHAVLAEGSWTDACLRIARDVAEALEHAHSRGVVHRDVKPSNIALTRSGRALLFDFGLALAGGESTRLTRTGSQAGSLPYMSPEQVEGEKDLDGRTDVWSLGVTLYELLTLQQPFDAPSSEATRASILAGTFARPRRRNPRLKSDVETVVLTALERERSRRYPTAGDLARDLSHLLARRPVEARRAGAALRLLRWSQRHPRASAATLAVGPVAMLALGALAWFQADRSSTERVLRKAAEDSAVLALVRAGEAEQSAELAAEREREAVAERRKVLRLADLKRLADLETQEQELYPARAASLARLDAWLDRAWDLARRMDSHREARDELRARGRRADGEPGFAFESDEDAWQHDLLDQLVARLQAFRDDTRGPLARVERLRELSASIEELTVAGPLARRRWEDVAATLSGAAASSAYAGLELAPIVGLLPLGRDPRSGLLEFACLDTGDPPQRGNDGQWAIQDSTAVVLVLVPPGVFPMGAQRKDPAGPNYDPLAHVDEAPVHDVELEAFLISKYEMTQGQWLRLSGSNPSFEDPAILRTGKHLTHPVEHVDHGTCVRVLSRAGLSLPTEAQWEYAARAGTWTPWWTGEERESLRGAANLADAAARRTGALWPAIEDWPELDDGFSLHAPVGRFPANPFGLHDVLGNVMEWCADPYTSFATVPRAGDGWRGDAGGVRSPRNVRGGSFSQPASELRCSWRYSASDEFVAGLMGVRPARSIGP